MDEEPIPLSQLANDAFNPVVDFSNEGQPLATGAGAPIDYSGLVASLTNGSNGTDEAGPGCSGVAGPGPGSIQETGRYTKSGKLFQDPIHGLFRLDPAAALIFDTRQFQRLRRLKQLGLTYQVFPGASHNRFEHSLGVAHLAYKFATHLKHVSKGEVELERRELKLVQLAGLCHDLGHGPFSHVFEREFLSRKGIKGWEHEDMSTRMLDYIIDVNHIDMHAQDVRQVNSMIMSGHGNHAKPPPGQQWLWEIVANERNGIDVDKFDYLARDSTYCGVKISCAFDRIVQFSKVIGDEICFKYTEYMNLHELFHSRASMHRQVYTHKKAKAIEFMVVDALVEADSALRISQHIWDPAQFQLLDDNLIDWIENYELYRRILNLEEEDEAALQRAQAIIARLRRRELYKYVNDALIPQDVLERDRWTGAPPAQEIANCYHGNDVQLRAEDIILQENKIDYSKRDQNPLDSVHFFDSLSSTEKRKLRPDQISSMVVASYQEKSLRVYSRNASPRHVQAVNEAFVSWIHKRFGSKVSTSTPCKPPRPPPLPTMRAAAAAAGAALAAPPAAGGKRTRELFGAPGGGNDDVSPSNLMKHKQPRN